MKHGQRGTVDVMGETCSAWISPSGEWYFTGVEGHWDAAERIMGESHCYGDPVEALRERGWIHLVYGEIILANWGRPTDAQEGALAEGVAYTVARGMTNRCQRAYITSCSYYIG